MPAQQSLQTLNQIRTQLDNGQTTTSLLFAAKLPSETPTFSIRNVQFHQRLISDLKNISSAALDAVCACALVEYSPSYKLDPNEAMYADLESLPSVKDLIDQMSNVDDLELMQDEASFFAHMSFYGIFHRIGSQDVLLLRGVSARNLLKRSKKLGIVFNTPVYDRFEKEVVMMDREIDCVAYGGYAFISNLAGFHKLTQYHEQVIAAAGTVIDSAAAVIPIANLEELKEVGTKDYRMAAKLASIKNKPYIATLTIDKVKRVIHDYGLPISVVTETGVEKLVFEKEPQRRFLILKVLDDDYLHSNMTETKYAVNSKIPST